MDATVTITPTSKDVKDTFVIFGVTGTPDPSRRQVQARVLSSTSTEQRTVPATGVEQTSGERAIGVLTFINVSSSDITIPGSVLTGTSGVQITFTGPVTVPANPPITAVAGYAVSIGTSGNIAALDIDGPCCVANDQIFVKNTTAFSGGQDAQTYTFVQQSDIDGAADALEPLATQNAQAGLQQQMYANEAAVNSPQCTLEITSNHVAGDKASNVTVTVQVTCTQEVYDQQAALSMAVNLLMQEAANNLGPDYALVGNVKSTVTQVTMTNPQQGTLSLFVTAEGIWVYQFSTAQKQALANMVAGKSKADALALLVQQPGVSQAEIAISGGGNTLPQDPHHILIIIQIVPGL